MQLEEREEELLGLYEDFKEKFAPKHRRVQVTFQIFANAADHGLAEQLGLGITADQESQRVEELKDVASQAGVPLVKPAPQ